jgi:hypothetical protein
MLRASQAWLLLVCLIGCGDVVAEAAGRTEGGSPPRDAAVRVDGHAHVRSDALTDDAGMEASIDAGTDSCPTSRPPTGRPCGTSLTCEYGSDPEVSCDTLLGCLDGGWSITSEPEEAGCGRTNSASCPATFSAITEGTPCSAYGTECYFPEARCWCDTGLGGMPLAWDCDIATTQTDSGFFIPDGGCPEPRPRLGTPCSASDVGLSCEYGNSCWALRCPSGAWVLGNNGCIK